jgi:hypothetical protein
MSKVYNFRQYAENYAILHKPYMEELYNALKVLKNSYDEIQGEMINLAVRDKWRKWNENKPGGFTFRFSDEMLASTGDENINDLFVVYEAIYKAIELITKRNKIDFQKGNGGDGNAE